MALFTLQIHMTFITPFCECGNYKTSGTDMCESCNRALRKEVESIKKSTAKIKKLLETKTKNNSDKRAKQEREYASLRPLYLEEHPFCQVKGCSKLSNQIHHKAGRIGILLLLTDWWLAVCETCHDKIENEPKWAKAQGYSISRLANKPKIKA